MASNDQLMEKRREKKKTMGKHNLSASSSSNGKEVTAECPNSSHVILVLKSSKSCLQDFFLANTLTT